MSTDTVEIVLLGAPRGKERPRGTRDGHFYTPDKTVRFEASLRECATRVMLDRPLLRGPLQLDMIVRMPISTSWTKKRQEDARTGRERPTKKPDFDNYAKVVDALNLIVWEDDAQIVDGRVRKFYSDKPGMWIVVRSAGEDVFG